MIFLILLASFLLFFCFYGPIHFSPLPSLPPLFPSTPSCDPHIPNLFSKFCLFHFLIKINVFF